MRRNKTVHWIAPAEAMAELHRRMAPHLPATLEGRALAHAASYWVDEG